MRTLKIVTAMLLAGALLGAGVTAVAGTPGKRPRSVAVTANGESVRAGQGSWCYFGQRRGICVDYAYPLRIKQRLRVSPGERVTFRMHDATIAKLSAHLLRTRGRRIRHVGSLEDIHRVEGNPRAWRATIPEDAANANAIDIFVRYRENRGDSNWWAGIRLAG
jgi:hypothetical protein